MIEQNSFSSSDMNGVDQPVSRKNRVLLWFVGGLVFCAIIFFATKVYLNNKNGSENTFVVEKILNQLLLKEKKYDYIGSFTSPEDTTEFKGSFDFSNISQIAYATDSSITVGGMNYEKKINSSTGMDTVWVSRQNQNENEKTTEADLRAVIDIFTKCDCTQGNLIGTENFSNEILQKFEVTTDIHKLNSLFQHYEWDAGSRNFLTNPLEMLYFFSNQKNSNIVFTIWIDSNNNLRKLSYILPENMGNITLSLNPNKSLSILAPKNIISYEEDYKQDYISTLQGTAQQRITVVNQVRIAIEAFKSAKGFYPESLRALVPAYLPKEPNSYPLGYLTSGLPAKHYVIWTDLFVRDPALESDDDVDATGPEWTARPATEGSPQTIKINGSIEKCAYQKPDSSFDCFYDLSDKSFTAVPVGTSLYSTYEDEEIKFTYDSSSLTIVNSRPGLNEVDLYLKNNNTKISATNYAIIRTLTVNPSMSIRLSVADDYQGQESGTNPNAHLYENKIIKKKIGIFDYYISKQRASQLTDYTTIINPNTSITISYNSTIFGSTSDNFKIIERLISSIKLKKTVSEF